MTTKTLRKIIKIDEDKCDGCGGCVIACAEGALKIIDGKAKLISEKYCDGLGACLGECPQGAIIIEERESEEFDEEAVNQHLQAGEKVSDTCACGCPSTTVTQFKPQEVEETPFKTLACGCPSTSVTQFEKKETTDTAPGSGIKQQSMLGHWPVQLTLVPPGAPFLDHADLVFAADCVPFAYPGFHQDFLKDHALLIACPKLDDFDAHQAKLTEILRQSEIRSLTVVHMEVPCCSGLTHMARQAIQRSGKNIPFKEITIGVKGDQKS